MVTKPEHHIGERLRHPHRRTIRSGEEFDSDALERGDIELEERDPTPEPGEERSEPWNFADEERMPPEARERLRLYREFIESRRREDPDYGDDS